jgi:polyisoprenoid-binding protein YceI
MKKILIFIVLILIILVAFASTQSKKNKEDSMEKDTSMMEESSEIENGSYTIIPEESTVEWTGRKTILKDWIDRGTINIQSGNLEVEGGEIRDGEIVIDMNSIEAQSTGRGSGESMLSNHLRSADFFDVQNFPTSTLKITSGDKDEIDGTLEIKGIQNPISFPIKITVTEGGKYRASGTASVDRTLYDVRFGSGKFFDNLGDNIVDDIFTLDFDVVLEMN